MVRDVHVHQESVRCSRDHPAITLHLSETMFEATLLPPQKIPVPSQMVANFVHVTRTGKEFESEIYEEALVRFAALAQKKEEDLSKYDEVAAA